MSEKSELGQLGLSEKRDSKSGLQNEPNQWAFIAPFLAFMLIAMLYPKFDQVYSDTVPLELSQVAESTTDEQPPEIVLEVNELKTTRYAVLVLIQVVVAFSLLFYFRKTYLEQFPVSVSWLSIPVGVIGVVLWIWLCNLGIERSILQGIGMEKWAEIRPSFDPFRQLPNPAMLWGFLIFRFLLLAVCVPMLEELFLRGWLMRYIENPNWWVTSLKNLSTNALLAGTAYGVLTHPSEAIAAIVWFSLVTWLMVKTGSIWDCVVAHAITNFLLGVYILCTGAWHLW